MDGGTTWDDKPVRILYISDHDPHGKNMPVSTARQIEFCRHQINPKADVMISQVVLTSDQVHEYELPHAPDNPRVELDALEALNPEALDEIVREAIEEWRDEDLQYRWRVS